jgi:hypothetical protein
MRPARKAEFGQHLSQDLQDRSLFFICRDKADEVAAIPAEGLHDVKVLEFGNDAPCGHLQAMLTNLAFEQTICQQGQHVDDYVEYAQLSNPEPAVDTFSEPPETWSGWSMSGTW